MRKASINPPQITQLAARMRELGIRPDLLTVKEMLDEIDRLLGEGGHGA